MKPATIVRNGVEMPIEQAARFDFDEAERHFAKKLFKNAIPLYQGIVDQMPTSSYSDNSLLRLAQIHRARKNMPSAVQNYESVIARYPTGDASNIAKRELGLVLYENKEYKRAIELLASFDWRVLTDDQRAQFEKVTRSAFELGGLERQMFPWLVTLFDATPAGTHAVELKAEVIARLDDFSNTRELENIVDQRRGQFPADFATLKLAKLAFHVGDRSEARRWVSSFLNRYPNHELYRDALILSESLSRADQVDSVALGLLIPLSGANKNLGDQVLRGAALAMNVFAKTSTASTPIRLYIADTGDTAETAVQALESLARERQIIAAIGPLVSKQSQAAALSAGELGLPLISLSAAEGVNEIGPTIFRNSLTKSDQAAGLAKFAIETLGIRRAAILYPQYNYGIEFMDFFWHEFERRGGEIRAAEAYDPENHDWAQAVKRIVGLDPLDLRQGEICSAEESERRKASTSPQPPAACYPPDKLPAIVDFEAIFIPDGYERASQIAPTLAYYDIRGIQLLGTNVWNSPELLKADNSKHLQGALFLDSFFQGKKEPPVPEFIQRFYSLFGTEPGIFEAQAFDTVSMVLEVFSKNSPGSRQAFAEALSRVKDYRGVTGTMTVGPKRDVLRPLIVLTVDDNNIVELH